MRVRCENRPLETIESDLAACFAYEGDRAPRGVAEPIRGELARQMKAEHFRGKPTDRLVWNTNGSFGAHRFVVIGLGTPAKVAGESIRLGAARAAREAARFFATRLSLRVPEGEDGLDPAEVRAAVEGVWMGDYRFERHLTDAARKLSSLKALTLSVDRATPAIRRAVERGQVAGEAVRLARDLVNEAPSRMNPGGLARAARREAKAAGLTCRVLGPAELKKLGMHALLAVARGSSEPAQVVHLTWKPAASGAAKRSRKRIVLVGKGVTFDSGGLNLKPTGSMMTMKSDMAGSAAVLGAMSTLRRVGCRAEVHALLGLVENMTGAAAYKPSDILDTYDGKTVEVSNTDAEGRLVMCDLLAYAADRIKPAAMVDVATLTGACVVALGTQASGLFSRHDALSEALLSAGSAAGERLWRLPMYEEYLSLLQKGPADLQSTGGRWGGAITAALFLGEFVPRSLPWAHLDIAGPAFTEEELPEARIGGTGAGVLTLMRWLETA